MQVSQAYKAVENRFPRIVLETTTLVALAACIGFLSTGISSKGLFRSGVAKHNQMASEEEMLPMLTYEDARDIYFQGNALFIDARQTTEFNAGHIKGAINIPLSSFQTSNPLLAGVPMDHLIVTYCNGTSCSSSARLAQAMQKAGYTNVNVFFGGWNEWVKNNQPVEP